MYNCATIGFLDAGLNDFCWILNLVDAAAALREPQGAAYFRLLCDDAVLVFLVVMMI